MESGTGGPEWGGEHPEWASMAWAGCLRMLEVIGDFNGLGGKVPEHVQLTCSSTHAIALG